jgi:Resolvase, N terminal domain
MNSPLENQDRDCRSWCAHESHDIYNVYCDAGARSTTLLRPGLQQEMQAARRGEYHLLIVWRYDRLSRVKVQQDIVLMLLRRHGVQVISETQPVPEGMAGDMLQGMYAFASQAEHVGVTSRLYGGSRARTEHGLMPGAPHALYGLCSADAYTPVIRGATSKTATALTASLSMRRGPSSTLYIGCASGDAPSAQLRERWKRTAYPRLAKCLLRVPIADWPPA